MSEERVVVDTNALISRLLVPGSVSALAVDKVVEEGQLLISEAVMEEVANVLARPKFDRYVSVEDRQQFLRLLGRIAEWVPVLVSIRACRDPDDDKFLELAASGEAETIVTGDADLLVLDPFQGISILTPAGYLARDQG